MSSPSINKDPTKKLLRYMKLAPQSKRETIYTGITCFLPIIGQLIILTRPKLSVGAKVRGSIYGLVGSFLLLMMMPVSNVDQPVADSSEEGIESIEVTEKLFKPRESCGDVRENADLIYPVYLDNIDLESVKSSFCRDAFISTREEIGEGTIVVASFDTLDKALEFSEEIGGRVGEPDISKVQEKRAVDAVPPAIQEEPPLSTQPIPQPKTDEQKFADTLVSATPGFLAQE